MRKKETPNPSRVRGRGVEVSETLFYKQSDILKNENYKFIITDNSKITEWLTVIKYITYVQVRQLDFKTNL